jgi:hypothetical protein
MTPTTDPREVTQRFQSMLEWLAGVLPDDERPVIGDTSYFYARCALIRSLLQDLLSQPLQPDRREQVIKALYRILAEAENMAVTAGNVHKGLQKVLDRIPD